jgi:hypothetical protein
MRVTLTDLFTLLLVTAPIVDGIAGGRGAGSVGVLVGLFVGFIMAVGNFFGFRAMVPRFVRWEKRHRVFTQLFGFVTIVWIFGSALLALLITKSIVH